MMWTIERILAMWHHWVVYYLVTTLREDDLEDGAIALERLKVELLGDRDDDQIHPTKMPYPQPLVGFQM